MNNVYIEQLLARYFDAETTREEEKMLRAYFSGREIPEHLRKYAPLFAWEEKEAAASRRVSENFEARVMARWEAVGGTQEVRVKALKMTFADRIRPLWRAAAAVALVVMVGGAAFESINRTPQSPVGVALDRHRSEIDSADMVDKPYRQLQNGMKMAVTVDSAQNTVQH